MKIYAAKSFVRDLNKLKDARLRKRIDTALRTLAAAESLSNLTNVKAMEGASDAYRMRVGDYRLGFTLQNGEITLLRCLHRRDIYRRFP
ncbi:MAG: type II toxin-antitoxin system RelE/ParE family toxin [Trueperaceae bacterium]|nr:type II toxin-antitoxin system RelE/ParE family toxin [Trueperaceae bacterium]